jgi:ABC-type Fe3+-hydroxamate transport system substrate-binding protein
VPKALGLKNVWASTANFTEVSAEVVVAATPDVILITYTGGSAEQTDAIAQAKRLFAASAAVRAGKVFALPENAFESGGVAIVDVITQTADDLFN